MNKERLAELKAMPYKQYLLTPEWQAKREQALERDGHRCRICNNSHFLNVHHRTYERRGDESLDDLTTLCNDCHELHHQGVTMTDKNPIIHQVVLEEYFSNLMKLREKASDGVPVGIPSGLPLLDEILGGFRKSKLIVLAGLTGNGKTTLALNFMDQVVKQGSKVLFFSLEMDKNELMQRWVAMKSGINSNHLRDGNFNDKEMDRLNAAMLQLADHPGIMFIDDSPINTSVEMRSIAHRIHAEHKIEMIIIDHIQIVDSGKRFKDRRLEIEEIIRSAKILARELDIPVIALAQLNKDSEYRSDNTPKLSDLKESSGIAQAADAVIFLHRTGEHDDELIVQDFSLIIEKNRDGRRGIVPLSFFPFRMRFRQSATNEE